MKKVSYNIIFPTSFHSVGLWLRLWFVRLGDLLRKKYGPKLVVENIMADHTTFALTSHDYII